MRSFSPNFKPVTPMLPLIPVNNKFLVNQIVNPESGLTEVAGLLPKNYSGQFWPILDNSLIKIF